jgi:SAM-dependent methyltransferase
VNERLGERTAVNGMLRGPRADDAKKTARQIAAHWSSDERQQEGVQWISVGKVARNVNRRATGSAGVDWLIHSKRFMEHLPKPRLALSLGCGRGIIERIVRERDICQFVEGIDIAEGAVERARELAADGGLAGLEYRVADLNHERLPEETYDVVYAHAVLHHLSALEHVFEQIRRTLKPQGVLVLYEYVGPAQMQFPREHLEVADSLLRLIPERYRVYVRAGAAGTKNEAPRLALSALNATDPSEGIRAPEILPLVASRFEIKHLRYLGGTVLLLVLNEIAGNFKDEDPAAQSIIESLVHLENVLVDSGTLPSYHAYAVCQKVDAELIVQTQGSDI